MQKIKTPNKSVRTGTNPIFPQTIKCNKSGSSKSFQLKKILSKLKLNLYLFIQFK